MMNLAESLLVPKKNIAEIIFCLSDKRIIFVEITLTIDSAIF